MKQEATHSGPWKIEPGTRITPAGVDELAVVIHERNEPIYVRREELPDLLGALMVYLNVQKIEAAPDGSE